MRSPCPQRIKCSVATRRKQAEKEALAPVLPFSFSPSGFDPFCLSPVAVLFTCIDSCYKSLPGVDVWDIDRDARRWPGGCPVIAHPPCRAWGRLRHFARPRPDERFLALFAAAQVRANGGVLEHPAYSSLWLAVGLPRPGERDGVGGWTLAAPQFWWGHRADKATWFYIVGCSPNEVPLVPFRLGSASHVIETRKRGEHRPSVAKSEREKTPPELAGWLVALARRCHV